MHIQNDLFDLGADLCVPESPAAAGPEPLRVNAAQVTTLESWIDEATAQLEPLKSFVLPGGTLPSAHLHQARTVCRRVEIGVLRLAEIEPINPQTIIYLNRLSDLLFVWARLCNDGGKNDVLWTPGKFRGAGAQFLIFARALTRSAVKMRHCIRLHARSASPARAPAALFTSRCREPSMHLNLHQVLDVVTDYAHDHWSKLATAGLFMAIGWLFGKRRARAEWRKREFYNRVNISLNAIREGTLRIRTIAERHCSDVFLNSVATDFIMNAAAQHDARTTRSSFCPSTITGFT